MSFESVFELLSIEQVAIVVYGVGVTVEGEKVESKKKHELIVSKPAQKPLRAAAVTLTPLKSLKDVI